MAALVGQRRGHLRLSAQHRRASSFSPSSVADPSPSSLRSRICRKCVPTSTQISSRSLLRRPGLTSSPRTLNRTSSPSSSPCSQTPVILSFSRLNQNKYLSGPPTTSTLILKFLYRSPSAFWALAHTIGPMYWKHIVTMTLWLVCNFLGPAYLIPSLLTWRTLSPSENSG